MTTPTENHSTRPLDARPHPDSRSRQRRFRTGMVAALALSATLALAGGAAANHIKGVPCSTCADHDHWPRMTLMDVQKAGEFGKHTLRGRKNRVNELLGWHGSDTLYGGDEPDVLWADHIGTDQPSDQVNRLYGGGNDDYLYSARGRNVLSGGAGNDAIKARYGRGTVDCGPGRDIVHLPKKRRKNWTFVGCESFEYRSELEVGHGMRTPGWETRHKSWPEVDETQQRPRPSRPGRERPRPESNSPRAAGSTAATVRSTAWRSIKKITVT